jgi:tetratricopeptide (TPR) repeat protein
MVQYGMGVINVMKDRYAEAILYFDKAIEINPYFVEAWYNKGSAHQKRLEIQPMIKAFRKVIELGDSSEHYVIQTKSMIRGFEKELRDEMKLSLDEYLAGMNIFNEAFTAMEKMEWEKAILGFKKVLAIDPRHTQSHGNLGVCYGHLGMKQEALAHLDRALELDPDYEPAIINREAIAALAEGEKLQAKQFGTIEFYKDFKSKNKSLVDMKFGR